MAGSSVSNDGPLFIGKDPWYKGVTGAGFDNVQIHNRALTEEEIKMAAAGMLLIDGSCVLALDFTGGVRDGHIKDLSTYGHHAMVVGNPGFTEGGAPLSEYIEVPSTVPSYMSVDGSNYLVIDHIDALSIGANNADFTVSFALMQTQKTDGEWRSMLHKGNVND